MIGGDYFFEDNLKYEFADWKYCTGEDRRLDCLQTLGSTRKSRAASSQQVSLR